MAYTNDASVATSDAWNRDPENGPIQPPEHHRKHRHEAVICIQPQPLPLVPGQDRPEPRPNLSPSQWMEWLAVVIRTSDRSLRARTKKEIENMQRLLTRVVGPAWKKKPWESDNNPKEATEKNSKALESVSQTIFLCMDRGPRGQYAARVSCHYPTTNKSSREVKRALKKRHSKSVPPKKENVSESDDQMIQIVERMRKIVGSQLGIWAKFVPYFGVIGAEIVEVSCSLTLDRLATE